MEFYKIGLIDKKESQMEETIWIEAVLIRDYNEYEFFFIIKTQQNAAISSIIDIKSFRVLTHELFVKIKFVL